MSNSGLTADGTSTSIYGYYSIDNTGDGTYTLSGSVKLSIDDSVVTNIQFLNLVFIFFKGDLVVHEEKIHITGRDKVDKNLEFSKIMKSDVVIESSYWVDFSWRATE